MKHWNSEPERLQARGQSGCAHAGMDQYQVNLSGMNTSYLQRLVIIPGEQNMITIASKAFH